MWDENCQTLNHDLDHLRQDNERLKGECGTLAKYVGKLEADLQSHKSCLEVARGALEYCKDFVQHQPYGTLFKLWIPENALHQINEVFGYSKTNPNKPNFNGMKTTPGPNHPSPPWQA